MKCYVTRDTYQQCKSGGYDYRHTPEGNWGRAAAGLLLLTNDWEKLLLLQRSAGVSDPRLWGIPGGARKETPRGLEDSLRTALSEALEELGDPPAGWLWTDPYVSSSDNSSFTYTTYVLEVDRTLEDTYIPKLNWEHERFHWYALDEALAVPDLHPGVREVLDNYVCPLIQRSR